MSTPDDDLPPGHTIPGRPVVTAATPTPLAPRVVEQRPAARVTPVTTNDSIPADVAAAGQSFFNNRAVGRRVIPSGSNIQARTKWLARRPEIASMLAAAGINPESPTFRDDIKKFQQSINKALGGNKLVDDGHFGPLTFNAYQEALKSGKMSPGGDLPPGHTVVPGDSRRPAGTAAAAVADDDLPPGHRRTAIVVGEQTVTPTTRTAARTTNDDDLPPGHRRTATP